MSRELILRNLRDAYRVRSNLDLVNELQSLGLVADESITIEDCADSDLIRAWNRAVEHGEEVKDNSKVEPITVTACPPDYWQEMRKKLAE